MSVDDTIRWSAIWPMDPWPETHVRPPRDDEPAWGWMHLWEQSNPQPYPQPVGDDFDAWWAERRRMRDRIWVAYCLPGFLVWDWSEEDVAIARGLVRGHVCGVCGAADDPGCGKGC